MKTRDLNDLAPMITAVDARKLYFPPTSAEMRKRGMAETPALTVEAGLDCHVADARWIGDLDARHGRGKAAFYEVACAGDLGFILAKAKGAPAQAVTCLEMAIARPRAAGNGLRCDLPENRDPRIGLVSYVALTGKDCPPDRVREIGHSPTRTAFELACGGGGGFIMMTSAPPRLDRPIDIHPCFSYAEGATVSCLYTDRKAQLAMVDHLASQAGIPAPSRSAPISATSSVTGPASGRRPVRTGMAICSSRGSTAGWRARSTAPRPGSSWQAGASSPTAGPPEPTRPPSMAVRSRPRIPVPGLRLCRPRQPFGRRPGGGAGLRGPSGGRHGLLPGDGSGRRDRLRPRPTDGL